MPRMARRIRYLGVVTVALLVSGCSDITDSDQGIDGFYQLYSVNNTPLPYSDSSQEITDGFLTIDPGGGFTWSITARSRSGGRSTTETESGTFESLGGNTYRFTFNDGRVAHVTHSGFTLTMASGTYVIVFLR